MSFNRKHSNETKEKMRRSRIGKIPWNKGKKGIYSQEYILKLQESHKRENLSEESRRNMSNSHKGKSSPKKGQKLSDMTKEKLRLANIGKKQSKETIEKRRPLISGKNAPNWIDGRSFEPYCIKFNNQKKEEIREQYGRKCYICEKEEKDNKYKSGKQIKLSVHHIDSDKEQGCNGKQWKLVPLCCNCHSKLHRGENIL